MGANTMVKICLLRTYNLAKNLQHVSKINWATQLREFLAECDHEYLFNNLNPDLWESKTEEIFKKYRAILRNKDFVCYLSLSTTAC